MQITSTIAIQVAIMFIIMMFGFACYKKKWITEAGSKEITDLLLKVVAPVVIILSYQRPFDLLELRGLGAAVLLSFISVAVSIMMAKYCFKQNQKVERYCVVFVNAGFIGIPIVQAVLGHAAVFYLSAYLACFNILLWTYGVMLMSKTKTKLPLKALLVNPGLIGVVLGLCLFISPWKLPFVLLQPLTYVSNLNTPLAMIVLGVFIAQTDLLSSIRDKAVLKSCFFRLIAVPLAVCVLFRFLPEWLNEIRMIILVASSTPVAVVAVMFAKKHDQDFKMATKIVSLSTVLCIATIPLIMLAAQYIW